MAEKTPTPAAEVEAAPQARTAQEQARGLPDFGDLPEDVQRRVMGDMYVPKDQPGGPCPRCGSLHGGPHGGPMCAAGGSSNQVQPRPDQHIHCPSCGGVHAAAPGACPRQGGSTAPVRIG